MCAMDDEKLQQKVPETVDTVLYTKMVGLPWRWPVHYIRNKLWIWKNGFVVRKSYVKPTQIYQIIRIK